MKERKTAKEIAEKAGPPWFGLPETRPTLRTIGGWSSSDSRPSLHLRHRWEGAWVEVETAAGEVTDVAQEERHALFRWFTIRTGSKELEPEDFPITLEANRKEIDVLINDKPVSFVVIGDSNKWVAYGQISGRTIRVDARGCGPAELELVEVNPGDYIDPSEAVRSSGG